MEVAQSAAPKDVQTIVEEEKQYVLSLKGKELLFEGLEGEQVKNLQNILQEKQFYDESAQMFLPVFPPSVVREVRLMLNEIPAVLP